MRYRYFVDCVACENSRFSSLFDTGDVSRGNVLSVEERGETAVFAGLVFANFSYGTAVLGTPPPPPNVPLLNNLTVNLGLKKGLNL